MSNNFLSRIFYENIINITLLTKNLINNYEKKKKLTAFPSPNCHKDKDIQVIISAKGVLHLFIIL